MSTIAPTPVPTPAPARLNAGMSRARRDQLIGLVIFVVLMAASVALQAPIQRWRSEIVQEPSGSMAEIAVTFPRLTLGGFRGLLATSLWIKAENAKNDRQWVELNSLYNIIGTLEPYFNTVYIFNAWNQAYNISAQWHDFDDKYRWVVTGLGHLYEGEKYNPNDPDLLVEEGHMYFLKLGGAFERIYYRNHWKFDIANFHRLNDKEFQNNPASDELKMVRAAVLRPEFNATLLRSPSGATGYGIKITNFDEADPKKEIDFPHGVSPFYFAYKEYQRVLAQDRQPSEISFRVIRFYPAMSLRMWCKDDLYAADDLMRELWLNRPDNFNDDDPRFTTDVLSARDFFRNVAMVAPMADKSFEITLQQMKAEEADDPSIRGQYQDAENTHRKHVMETDWYRAIGVAESDLFEGLVAWELNHRKVNASVITHLTAAQAEFKTANTVGDAYAARVYPLQNGRPNMDLKDYLVLKQALDARLNAIPTFLNTPAEQTPDLSFLANNPIEK